MFFATPGDFRKWLKKNHRSATELWVGFYKRDSGRPSITWPESVDEALCYGWIDGIRQRLDADSYVIRFTPRKRGSIWSVVNTRRAGQLIREGRMEEAGLRAFEGRDPEKTGYSFEQRGSLKLDPELEKRFRRNRKAWKFFEGQPPGYRKTAIFWVVSAKREETRLRRLQTLIDDCAAGRRIGLMQRKDG